MISWLIWKWTIYLFLLYIRCHIIHNHNFHMTTYPNFTPSLTFCYVSYGFIMFDPDAPLLYYI